VRVLRNCAYDIRIWKYMMVSLSRGLPALLTALWGNRNNKIAINECVGDNASDDPLDFALSMRYSCLMVKGPWWYNSQLDSCGNKQMGKK